MVKIDIAVVGFGNVGKFAVKAVKNAPDMELKGVVDIEEETKYSQELHDIKVTDDIKHLGHVDVAILAIPSMVVPEVAPHYLRMGINTVDSFDVHGEKLLQLKNNLHKICIETNTVSVISAGWDPGTDSLIRTIFNIMAPEGITYTNFGPGISLGHTVEAKKVPGVKDALAITIPKGYGSHKRLVYVELEQGTDAEEINRKITSSLYFSSDETYVKPVADITKIKDYGHGALIERKGVSSQTHNQQFMYRSSITNPAVTAQVMVSTARASLKQSPGCYIMLEIPLIDFLPETEKSMLIKELV